MGAQMFVDGPLLLSGEPVAALEASGTSLNVVIFQCIMAAVCRFGDVLTSYAILARVIPVTHSVGNCVKRVVVIAASVAVFKTPMSLMNAVGTGIALAGVFLYSAVKSKSKTTEQMGRAS